MKPVDGLTRERKRVCECSIKRLSVWYCCADETPMSQVGLLFLIETRPATFHAPRCSYVYRWFAQDYWNENKIDRQPWSTCMCWTRRVDAGVAQRHLHVEMPNDVAFSDEMLKMSPLTSIFCSVRCLIRAPMYFVRHYGGNSCLFAYCFLVEIFLLSRARLLIPGIVLLMEFVRTNHVRIQRVWGFLLFKFSHKPIICGSDRTVIGKLHEMSFIQSSVRGADAHESCITYLRRLQLRSSQPMCHLSAQHTDSISIICRLRVNMCPNDKLCKHSEQNT